MHSESNNGYPSNQQCPPQGYMPPPGQYQTPCGAYPIPHRNYPHRNSLWENIMDKTFINKKKNMHMPLLHCTHAENEPGQLLHCTHAKKFRTNTKLYAY